MKARIPHVLGLLALSGALSASAQTKPAAVRSIFDNMPADQRAIYEPKGMKLWDQGAPGAKGDSMLDTPELFPVLPAPGAHKLPAIVVFPGGGYTYLSSWEGFPIAEHFRDLGLAAFVLRYRLAPAYTRDDSLRDAQRAVRLLRAHAAELGIDPDRIAAIGFSAGGHLAANLATHGDDGNPQAADPVDRQSCRIQTGLLIYPGILNQKPVRNTEDDRDIAKFIQLPGLQHSVDAKTAPCFMVVGYQDRKALREHDLAFAAALEKANVRFELHVFGFGDHGFSMRVRDPRLQIWQQLAANWLTTFNFLPEPVFSGPRE